MKLLIVSDIHSNWPALRAIDEDADRVICLGDLVDYGPQPSECVLAVMERGWPVIKGNHDAAVAEGYKCGNYRGVPMHVRDLNRDRLGQDEMQYLSSLPLTNVFGFAGARFCAVHASLSDPLSRYLFPFTSQEVWQAELALADADFVLMGHTHWPWIRKFEEKTVVNPGSIGQPRDGDPRASYAIWEDGRVEIRRVEYPIEETVKALEQTGLDGPTVKLLAEILRRGG